MKSFLSNGLIFERIETHQQGDWFLKLKKAQVNHNGFRQNLIHKIASDTKAR